MRLVLYTVIQFVFLIALLYAKSDKNANTLF